MRTLTLAEMYAVSGGENTRLQDLGKCAMDMVTHGAAGGALGVLVGGPVGAKVGIAAGMISAVIGSDACTAGLSSDPTPASQT